MARWGSTEDESTQPLPGDGLVSEPLTGVTRSITIDAPAGAVWPWIAQMGSADLGRAGWYSYDRLDNAGVPSADRVSSRIPAAQQGDVLVPNPAFAWTVREAEPGAHLVLELKSPPGWFRIHTTWTLAVTPAGDNRSRLVERSWWDVRPRAVGVPFSLLFEVVDFVMMRKHLLGVRSRATANWSSLRLRRADAAHCPCAVSEIGPDHVGAAPSLIELSLVPCRASRESEHEAASDAGEG